MPKCNHCNNKPLYYFWLGDKKRFGIKNKVGLRKQGCKYAHITSVGLQAEAAHFLVQTGTGDSQDARDL